MDQNSPNPRIQGFAHGQTRSALLILANVVIGSRGIYPKTIQDKMPDQIKLHFALWTRRAVQTLILEQYQIKMPIRSVGEYLRRWGFTPQQPLKRAYEQNPKKVILIIENLPVHHSRPVKEWLETHKQEIEVHYLPSYSPERNPDEYFNRDLKHQVSNRPPARNRD